MNEANTKKLMDAAPLLFRSSSSRSPFALFHFECGDGWFELLLDLARKLDAEVYSMDAEARPYVEQVKEKYGTLRFYISCGSDKMHELIDEAERKSAVTCETCGAPGKVQGRGWLRCSCEACER